LDNLKISNLVSRLYDFLFILSYHGSSHGGNILQMYSKVAYSRLALGLTLTWIHPLWELYSTKLLYTGPCL
jgi:hypothetical protein